MIDRDTELTEMGLPSRNPFDFSGPSNSGLGPKPKTKAAQYQRDRYWRDKEPRSPTEKVLVVNAESSLGYSHRKAGVMIDNITELDAKGVPIDDLAEHEIDQHIRDCSLLIQKAIDDADRPAAVRWQEAMYEAIALRTSAHKARLEADIRERIQNPQNCYFVETGNLARFQRTGVVA